LLRDVASRARRRCAKYISRVLHYASVSINEWKLLRRYCNGKLLYF